MWQGLIFANTGSRKIQVRLGEQIWQLHGSIEKNLAPDSRAEYNEGNGSMDEGFLRHEMCIHFPPQDFVKHEIR